MLSVLFGYPGAPNTMESMLTVSVVTRTCDRPQQLQRAAKSLLDQAPDSLTWSLVNDGGDPVPVDRAAGLAREHGIETVLTHHEARRGRTAAAAAARACASTTWRTRPTRASSPRGPRATSTTPRSTPTPPGPSPAGRSPSPPRASTAASRTPGSTSSTSPTSRTSRSSAT